MDDVAGEWRRKGDAFLPPPPSSSVPFPALTPRGPGLLSSPSGSSPFPSPAPAADAIVLALPSSLASAAGSVVASTLVAGAMDGGAGEALLVRRSKPKKRPAPDATQAQGREFGGGDRFLALWRDYHDLRQEMEVKKRKIESANRRKLGLLAEVKFLRRRYKSLVKYTSQQPNYKVKGQDQQIQYPVGINEPSAFADHGVGTGMPSTSKNTNLDLNQDSVMNDKGFDRRGHQGYPKLGNFDQDVVDEELMTNDVKFSVCSRNTGNSPSSDDKRTNSWQDRLALQA